MGTPYNSLPYTPQSTTDINFPVNQDGYAQFFANYGQPSPSATGFNSSMPEVQSSALSSVFPNFNSAAISSFPSNNDDSKKPGFLDNLWGNIKAGMGTSQQPGPLATGLQAGSALLSAFNGWNQNKLARDVYNTSKEQFESNFAAKAKGVDEHLASTQTARLAATGGAYHSSLADTMAKYGV